MKLANKPYLVVNRSHVSKDTCSHESGKILDTSQKYKYRGQLLRLTLIVEISISPFAQYLFISGKSTVVAQKRIFTTIEEKAELLRQEALVSSTCINRDPGI